MAKRWNERSRKALTEFGTGGKMWKGAGGGSGGAVKSFSCPVQFIVFCFFMGDTFLSSRLSLFGSVKRLKGNLKKWNRKNVQLHLSLSSSELRFSNFLIQSHVKLKHTILFWLYIGMQGIYIGQGEDKMCCYSSIIIIFILLYLLL